MQFVYVVKRSDLFGGDWPHGFLPLAGAPLEELLAAVRERGFFVERRHAERDPSMKQLIPYCVVRRGEEVLLLRRLGAGGEARLHGKLSIGVGGHVEPVDGGDVLATALRRELEEEIAVEGPFTARLVGLLNDDTTEVGRVHAGLVHQIEVKGPVTIRETDTLEGDFVPWHEAAALCATERDRFETWSALILNR